MTDMVQGREGTSSKGRMMYVGMVCLVAALGGLLFGYDTAVVSGAIGFLQVHFELSAAMKGWAAACALAGCFIGVFIAGILSDAEQTAQRQSPGKAAVKEAKKAALYGAGVFLCIGLLAAVIFWVVSLALGEDIGGRSMEFLKYGGLTFVIWVIAAAILGAVATLLNPYLGRRTVLILAAILFLISAIGTAVPRTLTTFVIFRIIGGVGVGIASMTSPMYIAEISPARIRGRMVSINQLAIVGGILVVYFVNYFIAGSHGEEWNVNVGWRWMFGSESFPAIALLLLLLLVPESPRWLVKQKRHEQALKILTRVNGSQQAQAELGFIEETISHESSSLGQLFHRGMRLALVIGIVLAVLQQVTGINVILYYAPEIFKKLGSGGSAALMETIIVGSVNCLFTFVAIWTVDKLGRKPLMMIGSVAMGVALALFGWVSYRQMVGASALFYILLYIAGFAMSVGPVTWVILSEIFPTRIRGRAMAISTLSLWAANYVISQTFPMMQEHKWLSETFNDAFPFWMYMLLCVVLFLFVWLFVPETKGKSLEEIETMWIPDQR